tara:strand:+ start:1057 stop:2256 length:1200 start_codon:yes stop_codon:yes gene_type:complete
MLNKLENSIKFKKLILLLKDLPFFFLDYILIILSILKNLILKREVYKKNLVFVTGADDSFFESLVQLVDHFQSKFPKNILIVYNLGINEDKISNLISDYPNIIVKQFNFHEYPTFYSKRDNFKKLGSYAWKSAIIYEVIKEYKSQVIWMDTGNLVKGKLILLRIVLSAFGFISPFSIGSISEWTHPNVLDVLSVKPNISRKRNLTGGLVGFDYSNENSMKLLKDWFTFSKKEQYISPANSDRSNHRQDQSLLSILFYQNKKIINPCHIKSVFGLLVNKNPGTKIYFSESNNKELTKLRDYYYQNYPNQMINTIKECDIVFVLDFELLNKIETKILKSKKIYLNLSDSTILKSKEYQKNSIYFDFYVVFEENFQVNDFKDVDPSKLIFINLNQNFLNKLS